jgi:hypothetical protein
VSKKGLDGKSICKWSKDDLGDHWDLLAETIGTPRFACRNCGRSARKKKHLCKPERLKADS